MSSSPYWSAFVAQLEPYVPGEQPVETGLIKLNTNENPYGPSPRALAAIQGAAGESLRLYPPPGADALKDAIAAYYRLDSRQVFVGNGSDEVLAHAFNGLLRHPLPILFPDITYSFYPVYCGLYGIDYETVALDDTLAIDVENYCRPNGGIILANPNAPTGRCLPLTNIEQLLVANSGSVVVVDEAYVDFGGESAVPLIGRYNNLLVIQTFSKSRSLAGLRIGFAMGDHGLIEALERVKNSFNSYPLDRLAIAGGIGALEDESWFQRIRTRIINTRAELAKRLTGLGFEVVPSAANFILVRHPAHQGKALMQALRERRIVVRHFSAPRIDPYLRITVGTAEQMDVLVEALREILAQR